MKKSVDLISDIYNNRLQNCSSYEFDNNDLSMAMNIGQRKRQEDCALVLAHPLNDKYKILAVADGIGGCGYGKESSYIAIYSLLNWFYSLDEDVLLYEKEVLTKLYEIINYIEKKIVDNYRKDGGTTLVMSLVCKNNTFNYSIGDSMLNVLYGSETIYSSYVDSYSNYLYHIGKINDPNNIKFNVNNNVIMDYLGTWSRMFRINKGIDVISNTSYDKLALFSDGVGDFITHAELINPMYKARNYIDLVNGRVIYSGIDNKDFYKEITGGIDNMSVCLLKKIK